MSHLDLVNFIRNNHFLHLPLRGLPELPVQKRKKQAQKSMPESKICGADTETVNGKVWLFSTEFGVWEIDTFADLLDVLYSKPHAHKWKSGRGNRKNGKPRKAARGWSTKEFFFWNLKFDVQAVLHCFPDQAIDELLTVGEVEVDSELKGRSVKVKLKYLEGKYFEIKPVDFKLGQYKAGVCKWWDISQFYNKMRLNDASLLFLNDAKIECCFDGSILDVEQLGDPAYRDLYREDIEKYAIKDARLAGELTRLKRSDFVQNGVRFIQPFSLANLAQRNLLDMGPVPTINKYRNHSSELYELLAKANTSFQGGWFESRGNGNPNPGGKCSLIDLSSAYPYVMRFLPDINNGVWIRGEGKEAFFNYLDEREPYSIGFAEATIVFESGLPWHPLIKSNSVRSLVSPRIIRGWFTADELAEARQWPHTMFEIGEWFYFDEHDAQNRPFRNFIDHFYEIKSNSKDGSVARAVSKVMLCSIYGKCIQAIDGVAGKLYNPFYASTITGATRARLAELIRVNDFKAISVATDGVIFKSEEITTIPNRPLPAPYNLGQWELECEGELVVLMSGVYSMDLGKKVKTTYRGSASYFLKDYKDGGLFRFCADNSEESRLSVIVKKPISAKQARQKSDYSLINIFVPQEFHMFPYDSSMKRLWGDGVAETFGDLLQNWYESTPQQNLN